MKSPTDAEWRQQVLAQAEANKLYFENEKQRERERKEFFNNEYKNYEQDRENKQRQKALERAKDQQDVFDQVQRYKGDQQQLIAEQRSRQINLAQSYADQITQNKLSNVENRKKFLEEEQERIEKSRRQIEEEQKNALKRKDQARQDMLFFLNSKKSDGRYSESVQQPPSSHQQQLSISSTDGLSISSIGANNQKFQQYMKHFNEKQAISAKNFIPFDDKKGSRIDDLVTKGYHQEQQRYLDEEEQKRSILQSRRLDLKNGLQMQLANREKDNQLKKQELYDNQSTFQQRTNDYKEQEFNLKQKRLSEKQVYRDILDSQLAEKEQFKVNNTQLSPSKQIPTPLLNEQQSTEPYIAPATSSSRTPSSSHLQSSQSAIVLGHNPLTNPIPNHFLNPYLMRQILSSQTSSGNLNRVNYANLAQSNIVNNPNHKKTQIY